MTLDVFAMATLAAHRNLELNSVMGALETARLLADALEFRSDPGVWAMIHGAGLIWHLEKLHPFVLANANLLELAYDGLADLVDTPPLAELMTSLLGGMPRFVFKTTKVVGVAAGVRHADPGDPIQATASGQIGPFVQWGSGRSGFITAGHVAQSAQGPVTDANGARIGTVLWSNDPALNPGTKGDVDAALVEFTPGASRQFAPRPTIVPAGGDQLRIVSNNSTANLFAACNRIQLGATNAHYADCYLTDQQITNPGDSGGLVVANGRVAGIVIGAFSRRNMSVIQAVGYQIGQIRARSGHMVVT